jgi:hypothetical protein
MLKFLRKTALWIILLPVGSYFTGAASNQLVLIANHNTFPVLVNEAKMKHMTADSGTYTLPDGTVMLDYTHCIMTKKTHLNFLADVVDRGDIESVGDLLIDFGSWTWAFAPFIWAFAVVGKLADRKD